MKHPLRLLDREELPKRALLSGGRELEQSYRQLGFFDLADSLRQVVDCIEDGNILGQKLIQNARIREHMQEPRILTTYTPILYWSEP